MTGFRIAKGCAQVSPAAGSCCSLPHAAVQSAALVAGEAGIAALHTSQHQSLRFTVPGAEGRQIL
jgi:hypothetical protein